MMGYWGGNMMGWGGAGWQTVGSLMIAFWIVAFIDLVLLGLWLWKQLKKK